MGRTFHHFTTCLNGDKSADITTYLNSDRAIPTPRDCASSTSMSKFCPWILHNMQGLHEDPAEQVLIIHSTNGLRQLSGSR